MKNIELELSGKDATLKTTKNLQEWVKQEKIEGVSIERKTGEAKAGEMGLDPMTVLTVLLGSKAVVELVKSIHVWLRTRKRSLKLKIKIENREYEIDAENIPDLEKVLTMLSIDVSKKNN